VESVTGRDEFSERLIALLPRMKRYAYSLSRDSVSADDLVQSACERALAARDSWLPGTNLDAWAFRIVRNLWIDIVRHRKVAGQEVDIDEQYGLMGSDGGREHESRLMLQQVQRAILELPEEMREVIMLVCVDEQPYKDAADILGVPVGTVMSRLSRARLRLAGATGYREGVV
jgi:RNA polymerase sigma-70 factor, ECF subfamily